MPKKIAVWGITGSIGQNVAAIFRARRREFNVAYLSAHRNWELAYTMAEEFGAEKLVITDLEAFEALKARVADKTVEIIYGHEAIDSLSSDDDLDLLVNALVGEAGLNATHLALRNGIDVALANKESLVMAGELLMRLSKEKNAQILPIDSEHSAIWQCLQGEENNPIKRLILTASGGPFRTFRKNQIASVTPAQALRHPNWDMGNKITIDSATLMNKGLEFIEAYWLYPVSEQGIEVVVHPQSIIHSLVEFEDNSVKAQLGWPDMKIPIQYALSFPQRWPTPLPALNLAEVGTLTFEEVREDVFPAIDLARRALQRGGVSGAVLNVSNEQLVYAFLAEKIPFPEIVALTAEAVEQCTSSKNPDFADIIAAGNWARRFVEEKIKK
jgi:1-deoxy-D-xylulose-5-phosphate reductoisomerase